MSVSVEVYPELLRAALKQGLRVVARNPTNASQDITIKFQDDTGVFASLVTSGVKSGESRAVVLSDEDLGLSGRVGKNIVVYPEIPTPGSGVYLLGTTLAPGTRGNAVALKLSSTVKVSVLDEAGNALPFANVNVIDMDSGKIYHYVAGADGVCEIPDRPTADYGRWAIEAFKVDHDRQLVAYGLIAPWDYANTQITCKWARNFIVEVTLNFAKSDNAVINAIKNAQRQLPEPLKTFTDWLVSVYDWASDQVFNAVLPLYINKIKNSAPNVAYVRQEADTLKVGYTIGYMSPFSIVITPLAAIVLILLAIFTTISVYFASVAITAWSPSKVLEMQQKVLQQQQNLLNQLNQAYQQGALNKDQYNQAVQNITGAYRDYLNNIPKLIPTDMGLLAIIGIVVTIIIIIALIKALKG
jgi:uncharacterized membrane protein